VSVYRKSKNGQTAKEYSYDFELGGRRFSGSTGATSEREAKRIEKTKRDEAAADIAKLKKLRGSPWTVNQAITSYFQEKLGGEADDDILRDLEWIQKKVGHLRMLEVDDAVIADVVLSRSRELNLVAKKNPRLVSDSTVNRTALEPLRRLLERAFKVHKQPFGEIDWKQHRKPEPRERIRELTFEEQEKLYNSLDERYHAITTFHLLTGVRKRESVGLRWRDVDFGNRQIWINGKGDKRLPIPMTPTVRDLLFPLQGHHPEFVFSYAVKKSMANPKVPGKRLVKGERRPITKGGYTTEFRRAIEEAGIVDFRMHDKRHTAASLVLRSSNLKVVQTLLRHANIKTTTRYAHVTNDDVMLAMEAAAERTAQEMRNRSLEAAEPHGASTPTKSPTTKAATTKKTKISNS